MNSTKNLPIGEIFAKLQSKKPFQYNADKSLSIKPVGNYGIFLFEDNKNQEYKFFLNAGSFIYEAFLQNDKQTIGNFLTLDVKKDGDIAKSTLENFEKLIKIIENDSVYKLGYSCKKEGETILIEASIFLKRKGDTEDKNINIALYKGSQNTRVFESSIYAIEALKEFFVQTGMDLNFILSIDIPGEYLP